MFILKSGGPDGCKSGFAVTLMMLAPLSLGSINAVSAQTLTTLASFNGTNGSVPVAALYADGGGNLFGSTIYGGTNGDGTVFEIVKSASGYSSTPVTLVNFNGNDGRTPYGALIADAKGDLFGTTYVGGTSDAGTVFEIAKTSGVYASSPTTLVDFNFTNGAAPYAGLLADGNGNLFGTTTVGQVFEVANTADGYSGTPITLADFGAASEADLIADANGDLFGTTAGISPSDNGAVFEIPKTSGGFSSPTILATFSGSEGLTPYGGLIADTEGNLFGSTAVGGAYGGGTVYEIEKTSNGYASTPTVLINFNGTDGLNPWGSLIVDAHGNLFGTTLFGGPSYSATLRDQNMGFGTVFEIPKTVSGYAPSPVTLVNFNQTNGEQPSSGLIADEAGNLFGTTSGGGTSKNGTVYEITGSGFVPFFSPFASFHAELVERTTTPSGFALGAEFTTSASDAAIDPAAQVVTLSIGSYSATIPAGSFRAAGHVYVYEASLNGAAVYAVVLPTGGNRYLFGAASSENLSATTRPVAIKLSIGRDTGTAQVNAVLVR